ncbi:retinol dehydrogenase 12 [Mollisia scopiformis]|uniref:Retinol dehydrogenase 12 n=1 Tax=Mollisia scopiformis TaxID=149040 RepID=A0A194XSV2_MOLSC|nr:retinol dehydrogenase 12 [Mollisia scopiformis]KUJ23221.1 retinol dehydrogenase 12 [Mollisia scopiformis]
MAFFLQFLKSQLWVRLPIPSDDYSEQVIAITGANTGLGFESARHFLRLGAANVILCVRTRAKGESAADELVRSLHVSRTRIEVWEVDLASFASIEAFGEKLKSLKRLDVFVQNAGILTTKFARVEGCESHIAINVVSAAYLSVLALQVLQRSSIENGAKGRMVFVGSDLHLIAKFKEKNESGSLLKALNSEALADMNDRYKVSKLLLLYFVRDLAVKNPYNAPSVSDLKLNMPSVVIDYITPGACDTSIFRDDVHWIQQAIINVAVRLIARTAEEGSRTILSAVSPSVGRAEHGAFLMDCKVVA